MKITTLTALAVSTVALAACQPTPGAQAVATTDDLDAVEFSMLDTNNDGMISASEREAIASVADNGGNAIPESQQVQVDDM